MSSLRRHPSLLAAALLLAGTAALAATASDISPACAVARMRIPAEPTPRPPGAAPYRLHETRTMVRTAHGGKMDYG